MTKNTLIFVNLLVLLTTPLLAQTPEASPINSNETKPVANAEQKPAEAKAISEGGTEKKSSEIPSVADPNLSDKKKSGKTAKEPMQLGKKKADASKPMERSEAIKRANAFFNSSPVMTADFVQIGGDGKRSEGKLYVQRAGRVRFEYAQPATMEVIADGVQVAVRDRKLATQDLYFISQTPLKFLMKEKIDLEKDVTVQDVATDDTGITIFIEDKATFGGTSHVRLIFDLKTFNLKQWQVKDPQGYETLISLFNIDQTKTPDAELFKISK